MAINPSLQRNYEMVDMVALLGHYFTIIEVSDLFGVDHRINDDRRNIQIWPSLQ